MRLSKGPLVAFPYHPLRLLTICQALSCPLAVAACSQRAQLGSQMLLDGLDLFIPANNLGLVTLDDRKVGAIGVVTSWMALKQIWAKA